MTCDNDNDRFNEAKKASTLNKSGHSHSQWS